MHIEDIYRRLLEPSAEASVATATRAGWGFTGRRENKTPVYEEAEKRRREVYRLCVDEGKTIEEVAKALGINRRTVVQDRKALVISQGRKKGRQGL